MKNKRTLIISVVAVLAVILSVTAFFALPSSAKSAQVILVSGSSLMKSPGDEYIQGQQVQELNTSGATLMKSPGDEYITAGQYYAIGSDKWKSFEAYIKAHLAQAVNADGTRKINFPGDEYIPFFQDRWISTHELMQKHLTK